jgi:hypothetical protein
MQKCGNGVLEEGEACDYLSQPHKGISVQGYIDKKLNWDSNPETNLQINIGCTSRCEVVEGFRCP